MARSGKARRCLEATSCTTRSMRSGSGSIATFLSRRASTSRSWIMRRRRSASERMSWSAASRFPASIMEKRFSSTSALPAIVVMGPRSSCATTATNSSFVALASSAVSSACSIACSAFTWSVRSIVKRTQRNGLRSSSSVPTITWRRVPSFAA